MSVSNTFVSGRLTPTDFIVDPIGDSPSPTFTIVSLSNRSLRPEQVLSLQIFDRAEAVLKTVRISLDELRAKITIPPSLTEEFSSLTAPAFLARNGSTAHITTRVSAIIRKTLFMNRLSYIEAITSAQCEREFEESLALLSTNIDNPFHAARLSAIVERWFRSIKTDLTKEMHSEGTYYQEIQRILSAYTKLWKKESALPREEQIFRRKTLDFLSSWFAFLKTCYADLPDPSTGNLIPKVFFTRSKFNDPAPRSLLFMLQADEEYMRVIEPERPYACGDIASAYDETELAQFFFEFHSLFLQCLDLKKVQEVFDFVKTFAPVTFANHMSLYRAKNCMELLRGGIESQVIYSLDPARLFTSHCAHCVANIFFITRNLETMSIEDLLTQLDLCTCHPEDYTLAAGGAGAAASKTKMSSLPLDQTVHGLPLFVLDQVLDPKRAWADGKKAALLDALTRRISHQARRCDIPVTLCIRFRLLYAAKYLVQKGWGTKEQSSSFARTSGKWSFHNPIICIAKWLWIRENLTNEQRDLLADTFIALMENAAYAHIPQRLRADVDVRVCGYLIKAYALYPRALSLLHEYILSAHTVTTSTKHFLLLNSRENPTGIHYLYARSVIDETACTRHLSEDFTALSPEDLLIKIEQLKGHLQAQLRIARKDSYFLDLSLVNTCKKYKALIKSKLKEAPHPRLEEQYRDFCRCYDIVVCNDIILNELRAVSSEYRRYVNAAEGEKVLSGKLYYYIASWSSDNICDATEIQKSLPRHTHDIRRNLWALVRANVLAEKERCTTDLFWHTRVATFLHGTRLTPGMLQKKGLLPRGEMEEGGIVPFSGERGGSITTINTHHISGSIMLAKRHLNDEATLFLSNSRSRFADAVDYSRKRSSLSTGGRTMGFDLEEALKSISPQYVLTMIHIAAEIVSEERSGYFLQCRRVYRIAEDILTLRSFDPALTGHIEEQLKPLISALLKERKCSYTDPVTGAITLCDITSLKPSADFLLNVLERIHRSISLPLDTVLTDADRALLAANISVVFGSTHIPRYSAVHVLHPEVVARGKQSFGSQIDVAFAAEHQVSALREYMDPLDVRVYSYETGLYQELLQTIAHENRTAFEASLRLLREVDALQARLCFYIDHDILPAYGKPFLENATYRVDGKTHPVEYHFYSPYNYHMQAAKYSDYLSDVREKRVCARQIHGKMHAVRTAIAAQVLVTLHKRGCGYIDTGEQLDPFLVSLAASAHDWVREDDSIDRWDEEGAAAFAGYLQTAHPVYLAKLGHETARAPAGGGGAAAVTASVADAAEWPHTVYESDADREMQPLIETYRTALAHKDPHGGVFTTTVQKIVHDADCLEINRCIDPAQFDKSRLCFVADNIMKESLQNALIAEWQCLIQMTEKPSLKLYLEDLPDGYYFSVLHIIAKHPDKFPLLNETLEEQMEHTQEIESPLAIDLALCLLGTT